VSFAVGASVGIGQEHGSKKGAGLLATERGRIKKKHPKYESMTKNRQGRLRNTSQMTGCPEPPWHLPGFLFHFPESLVPFEGLQRGETGAIEEE